MVFLIFRIRKKKKVGGVSLCEIEIVLGFNKGEGASKKTIENLQKRASERETIIIRRRKNYGRDNEEEEEDCC